MRTLSIVVVSISACLALGCGGGSSGGGGTPPPGVASQLAFDDQPQDVDAGATLPPITVRIEDVNGNLVTTATGTVTVAADHPAGVTLGGDTTKAAVGGIATFDDLTLSQAGTAVTLFATLSGLTQDESEAFDVDPPAAAVPGGSGRIFAVNSSNRLLTFDAADVIEPRSSVAITGLLAGDDVLAIDLRPATGELFAISDGANVYRIDITSGVATRIGTSALTGLAGAIGIDFNPTVDRLRVVTDANDNIRVNPADGVQTTDTDLSFAAGDPNVGDDPQVAAVAYTNPFAGTATTALFGIDAFNDVLVQITNPNGGTMTTIGALGENTSSAAALDIVGGSTAFAMLDVAGVLELHRINLATGAATQVGTFADQTILDIAFEAPTVVAVTSDSNRSSLVTFGATAPGTLLSSVDITGLQTNETIVGIDYRPATNELYGVGSTSRLYRVNQPSGVATSVGVLSTTLSGAAFGVDFDATTDRLIVVSDTGQNLSVHPTTAVAATGATIFAGADVIGLAGTPNVPGTTTSFLGLDAANDQLVLVNTTTGAVTNLGALGVNISTLGGLDESQLGVTYAVVDGTLRTIELNGAASLIGTVGTPLAITGMAVPTVARARAYVIDASNGIREIDLGTGGVRASGPVTGLVAGETLRGIDLRPAGIVTPATSALFALGVNGTSGSLYTINPTTFVATQVGVSFTVSGTSFGFDFNPVPDRIRVVSDTGSNFRLNPNDGTISGTDTALNPGTPTVVGAAYTNNVTPAPTSTTLYVIDSGTDQLMLQGGNPSPPGASPNTGTLTVVGALGVTTSAVVGFDISRRGVALAVLDVGGSGLYAIDLASGTATLLYTFGTSTGLTIAP